MFIQCSSTEPSGEVTQCSLTEPSGEFTQWVSFDESSIYKRTRKRVKVRQLAQCMVATTWNKIQDSLPWEEPKRVERRAGWCRVCGVKLPPREADINGELPKGRPPEYCAKHSIDVGGLRVSHYRNMRKYHANLAAVRDGWYCSNYLVYYPCLECGEYAISPAQFCGYHASPAQRKRRSRRTKGKPI